MVIYSVMPDKPVPQRIPTTETHTQTGFNYKSPVFNPNRPGLGDLYL